MEDNCHVNECDNAAYLTVLVHDGYYKGKGSRFCFEHIELAIDCIRKVADIPTSTDDIGLGMDLQGSINEGQKIVAQIDTIEEILKLPLCTPCKQLIGGL